MKKIEKQKPRLPTGLAGLDEPTPAGCPWTSTSGPAWIIPDKSRWFDNLKGY